jgi:hypothetical protein
LSARLSSGKCELGEWMAKGGSAKLSLMTRENENEHKISLTGAATHSGRMWEVTAACCMRARECGMWEIRTGHEQS